MPSDSEESSSSSNSSSTAASSSSSDDDTTSPPLNSSKSSQTKSQIKENKNDQNESRKPSAKKHPPGREVPKRYQGFKQKDFHGTMDHLIAVGQSLAREHVRTEYFCYQQEPRLVQQHQCTLDHPSKRPGAGSNMLDNYVHHEDIRIYGIPKDPKVPTSSLGFAKLPWPPGQIPVFSRGKPFMDTEIHEDETQWNVEHGDTIHPIAFAKAKLSQTEPETQDEWDQINANNLHVSSTNPKVQNSDVPEALLLHCWQRAVHAMSTVSHVQTRPLRRQPTRSTAADHDVEFAALTENLRQEGSSINQEKSTTDSRKRKGMDVGAGGSDTSSGGDDDSDEDREQNSPSDFSPRAAKRKCETWSIRPSVSSPRTCPRCQVTFNSDQKFDRHFYGYDDVHGCCWPLVRKKQQEKIHEVLVANVRHHIKGLIEMVMFRAQKMQPPDNKPRRRLLDWYDILQFAKEECDDATVVRGGYEHPVTETIQTRLDEAKSSAACPMVLNPMIIQALRRRLVARYSEAPY